MCALERDKCIDYYFGGFAPTMIPTPTATGCATLGMLLGQILSSALQGDFMHVLRPFTLCTIAPLLDPFTIRPDQFRLCRPKHTCAPLQQRLLPSHQLLLHFSTALIDRCRTLLMCANHYDKQLHAKHQLPIINSYYVYRPTTASKAPFQRPHRPPQGKKHPNSFQLSSEDSATSSLG